MSKIASNSAKNKKTTTSTEDLHSEYRVLEVSKGVYSISNIFFKKGKMISAGIPNIAADNLATLRWDMRRQLEAFNKPVVKWNKKGKLMESRAASTLSRESLFQKYKD